MRNKTLTYQFTEAPRIGQRLYFNRDIQILQARTIAIELPSSNAISSTFSFTGQTMGILPIERFSDMFITLCDSNRKEIYKDLPAYQLITDRNTAKIYRLDCSNVDTQQSYFYFTNVTGITTQKFFQVRFFLDK